MARFRGTLQGQRGQASRLGSEKSGLRVEGYGWNLGATVSMFVGPDGEDRCKITLTEGSGYNSGRYRDLGTYKREDLESRPAQVLKDLEQARAVIFRLKEAIDAEDGGRTKDILEQVLEG